MRIPICLRLLVPAALAAALSTPMALWAQSGAFVRPDDGVGANALAAAQADPAEVQNLIRSLQNPDPIERLVAAKQLGKIGPDARAALPALQKLLQDPDEDVRRVAENSIRLIGAAPGPSEAVRKLMGKLESPDVLERLVAAKELARFGKAAEPALPGLRKLLSDPDQDVRRVAENTIRLIGGAGPAPNEAVRKLMVQLQSTDALDRLIAAKELAKMGPAAREALPALQKLQADPDEDVRRVAANAIAAIQDRPVPTPAAGVAGTTWSGTESLAGFGNLTFQFLADGKAFMIDAKQKVGGKWAQAGSQVTITFGDCEYVGTVQGDKMAGKARFTKRDMEWTFSLTRSRLAPGELRAEELAAQNPEVEGLILDLGSPDVLVRLRAAKALGNLGPSARDALGDLQRLLQDPDIDVRRVAEAAIARIQSAPPPAPRPEPVPPAPGESRRLTEQEVKAMLEKLGHEIETLTTTSGASKYQLRLKRGSWTIPLTVELSPNKRYMWISNYLGPLPEDSSTLGNSFSRLLEANWSNAPAFFSINVAALKTGKQRRLYLQRPMENQGVTETDLGQTLDAVADVVQRTAPIWQIIIQRPTVSDDPDIKWFDPADDRSRVISLR